jgi:hypothetical protein
MTAVAAGTVRAARSAHARRRRRLAARAGTAVAAATLETAFAPFHTHSPHVRVTRTNPLHTNPLHLEAQHRRSLKGMS